MADKRTLVHKGMVKKAGRKGPPKSERPASDPKVDARAGANRKGRGDS